MTAKEITVRHFEVDPQEIVFIKAILESYEGMCVVRTVEVGEPIIELLIAHDFQGPIEKVIADLRTQVKMEEIKINEN